MAYDTCLSVGRCYACRILDNLPAAMVKYREEAGASIKMYEMGFPIGFRAQTEVTTLLYQTCEFKTMFRVACVLEI